MPVERFFIENPLQESSTVTLTDSEFHHLTHVIRCQEGETVELINGKGALAQASILSIKKKEAVLNITKTSFEPPQTIEIVLAQAIPRMNRLDTILEKGTELGVTQFWLFPSELGERKELTAHQLERQKGILIAAIKQSGRLFLPQIVLKPKLSQWKKLPYTAFYGDLSSQAKPLKEQQFESAIIFIGPESGFTQDEEAVLQQLGVIGIRLNNHTLRTDTAAIAALAIITHLQL